MITLVLILYLSPIFGGTVHATLKYPTLEACQKTAAFLVKQSVKHDVVQECR